MKFSNVDPDCNVCIQNRDITLNLDFGKLQANMALVNPLHNLVRLSHAAALTYSAGPDCH